MKAYIALAVVIGWALSTVAGVFFGIDIGQDREVARQSRVDDIVKETRKAAQLGAADAISKIKVNHQTVRAKTETIVRENVHYVSCKHDDLGMRLINEALTGRYGAPGGGKLPRVNAVD